VLNPAKLGMSPQRPLGKDYCLAALLDGSLRRRNVTIVTAQPFRDSVSGATRHARRLATFYANLERLFAWWPGSKPQVSLYAVPLWPSGMQKVHTLADLGQDQPQPGAGLRERFVQFRRTLGQAGDNLVICVTLHSPPH
jgi:hypothetical protein